MSKINIDTIMGQVTKGNVSVGSVGGLVGGAIGAYVGGPTGATIGSTVGANTEKFILSALPKHTISNGSSNMNYYKLNRKPYGIAYKRVKPDTAKQISDYYNYWGCKTSRREVMTYNNYMYQNHAFVKGEIEIKSRDAVPINYQKQIQNIFNKGVHFIV